MELELNGKRALVTGSTKGIGRAIAAALLREGATVFVNGRTAESVEGAVETLRAVGDARPAVGDVGTSAGASLAVAAATRSGPVDILVNNVGIFAPEDFGDIPDERWREFWRVNVLSGVRTSRALLPPMLERGWGRIVFVSSESGINVPPEMIHYGVTKTAQLGLARGLAKLTSGTGVTVNSVLPGPTWSEGVAEFVAELAEQEERDPGEMREAFVPEMRPSSLIQRFADPAEVADIVAFLVSARAALVNGAAQRAEGGVVESLV